MRHESALGTWQMLPRAPDPRLRGQVLAYTGYEERTVAPLRRIEAPIAAVPLILSLGPPLLVDGVAQRSFVAPLDDRAATTEHAGEQLGIQVDLAPLAARRLLGLPLRELRGRVVGLDALLGDAATTLVERLAELPDWPRRFALVDRMLLARLSAATPIAPEIEHAWARLSASGGAVGIGALAVETGWSRRHLTARFHSEIGLPPKAVARIMRFQRVTAALRCGAASLADLAYDAGYADQSHLNREFRALAGTTPTAYAARVLPDGGGVGEVANVQDGLARAA